MSGQQRHTSSRPEPQYPPSDAAWRETARALQQELEEQKKTGSLERQRFASLLKISTILSSTLNLPRLLDVILDATNRLTSSEAASILLIDQQTGSLFFEATSNIPRERMKRIQVPIEGSVAGWVVQHGQPKIIQEVKSDKRFTVSAQIDSATEFSTRSLLAVPMKAKGKVIGVVEALNKKGGQSFVDEDVVTLTALAGQAAVAVENARLFQQSDLIAEMVHELRTPLMALMAMSELLSRPELPAGQRAEFAHTIQAETQRLTAMTSSFLELARLESGRVHIRQEPVDLEEAIQETVAVQRQQAAERGIAIHCEVAASLPVVVGDRDRIKQVLHNLISNAIKYNRPDGEVVISVVPSDEGVQVCVRDTGRGISPDAVRQLFTRFYRVPDEEGYTTGTGLGLSICQQIVQGHGGRMWVESELGVGSCFCFALSLKATGPAALRFDEDL